MLKIWLLVALLTGPSACASLAQTQEPRDNYDAYVRRAENRLVETTPLKTALLEAGGDDIAFDTALPELKKSVLLSAPFSGVLHGQYRQGIAAKWGEIFTRWCKVQGGGVFPGKFEKNVLRYISSTGITSNHPPYRTHNDNIMSCYDASGVTQLGRYAHIATMTLVAADDPTNGRHLRDYLLVETTKDFESSRKVVNETIATKTEIDLARKARERDDAIRANSAAENEWASSSQSLRSHLATGDSIAVVFGSKYERRLVTGLVIEVKPPLTQVQFSGPASRLEWVKIDQIVAPQPPHLMFCMAQSQPNLSKCLR